MPSKRAKAVIKTYVEIDQRILEETGEFVPISEPIRCPVVTTKCPRGKFEVTYTAELFNVMKELGNKKIDVFAWLLDNKDGNNCINTSLRQISAELNISYPTVQSAIKTLKEADLLTQQGTVYMISPNLMVKGSQVREAYLMRKYEEMSDSKVINFPESEVVNG